MKHGAAAVGVRRLRRQRGLSILGLVLALIPIVVTVLIGFKVMPAYYEHQRILAVLRSMDDSGQTLEASDRDLRSSFDRRAQIEDIHSVVPSDLSIDKVGDRKVIHVEYAAKVPLIDRVSLLIEFSASSAGGSGKH